MTACHQGGGELQMWAGLFLLDANVGLGTIRPGLRVERVWRTGRRPWVDTIEVGKYPRGGAGGAP